MVLVLVVMLILVLNFVPSTTVVVVIVTMVSIAAATFTGPGAVSRAEARTVIVSTGDTLVGAVATVTCPGPRAITRPKTVTARSEPVWPGTQAGATPAGVLDRRFAEVKRLSCMVQAGGLVTLLT